jgi:hypothetical protein
MRLGFSQQFFEKRYFIKFHGNPSSGTELFHAERQRYGWIEMTKLIIAFRIFAAPKN